MSTARQRRRGMAALVTAGALVLSLGACSSGDPESATGERPVVLTTFTVLADVAANVAGEDLRVESITKAGAEIHGYEPTPQDIRRASQANLILDNGLGLETWFAKFVHDLDVPHVVVSEGITEIPIAEDAYAGKPNPHAWMSPLNVQRYVENMVTAFSKLDPAHAEGFKQRGDAYRAQLQIVQDELIAALAELPQSQRALVSCEGAFSYLARDAGLEERYIWPVNAEQQATPQQIAGVIEFVKEKKVPGVFCESTISNAPMMRVVEATGSRFGGVLFVDSLSDENGPVPTYLDMIRHDTQTIISGLTGKTS